jgi:putative hydrolase of the HAD superfamily
VTVSAVIFDWGGTLTPWHTVDLREQWAAYSRVYDPARADELAGLLLDAETDAWRAAREHQRSGTFDDLLRSVGVDPGSPRHPDALAAYEEFWTPHTFIDPEAPPLLSALRDRGLKVGVLSNTIWPRAFHEEVFRRDGVLHLVDGAVYTSEIPWTKPHPEAFRAAMRAVGVDDPGAVVFVGDRPYDDVHGAKQVGMRAVLVPHSAIPSDQKGHVEGSPDAVVRRLADLLEVVDRWAGED